jgi:hypothetical protein
MAESTSESLEELIKKGLGIANDPNARQPARLAAGVYFLFNGDDLVHVERAINIHARAHQHLYEECPESVRFTHYAFIECSPNASVLLERELREALLPQCATIEISNYAELKKAIPAIDCIDQHVLREWIKVSGIRSLGSRGTYYDPSEFTGMVAFIYCECLPLTRLTGPDGAEHFRAAWDALNDEKK